MSAPTVSDRLGAYTFYGVVYGHYEITVTLAGFEPVTRQLSIDASSPSKIDFQLSPKGQTETVTVSAEDSGVNLTSSSGGAPALNENLLKSLVQRNQDFQDALPLLPGVVRGIDGLIRIKGGRTNQANTLVNSASVTDTFTGQPALSLPSVAIHSVQVLSNPFSSEYGQFASGVVNVDTRGGTDEWKWLFEDPIPRFRWIDHRHTHGVESASPHLTFAGPLHTGKAWIFQSLGYGYDTVTVPSLPNPDNVRIVEKINTYSQLDWNLTPAIDSPRSSRSIPKTPATPTSTHSIPSPSPPTIVCATTFSLSRIAGFWPMEASSKPCFRPSNSMPVSIQPRRQAEMILFPEQNSGSYFEQQQRNTHLYQWSQTLHLRPIEHAGRHLPIVGYSWSHSTYQGQVRNFPIQVLREDGTMSSSISYPAALDSQAASKRLRFFRARQLADPSSSDLGYRPAPRPCQPFR